LRKFEGYLVVSCEPFQANALVLIDGDEKGKVPGEFTLAAGTYTVQVETETLTGKQNVTIEDGKTESVMIPINEKLSRWEKIEQYDDWKWKWMATAIGAGVFTAYGYYESMNAAAAHENMEKEGSSVTTAGSYEEAEAHDQKAKTYSEEVDSHNQNSMTASLIAVGLTGLAVWFYLDEPENPHASLFQPVLEPNGKVGLAFNNHW
jgi:PEGA domain